MNEDVVILGGGLAGLAASMFSGAPLFEADDNPGGAACSDNTDGFVFDRGIHILQSTNRVALELLDELGIQFLSHKRNAFIYSNRTYTPYPFQVNTAGLPVTLRLRCVWSYLRRRRDVRPRNYEEWMYRSLGRGFAETFLIPYSEKFWTVHPREMTFEWTRGRVPEPTIGQVLRGSFWSKATKIGSNAQFRYPVGSAGYGAIAAALKRRAGTVHGGHRATSINTRKREVTFSNGRRLSFERLISSIPLRELIQICVDAPDYVQQAAAKLRTNSILVVNLGIDRPNLSSKHWVHFPEKDVSFFRISYPHNFGPDLAPKGTSSISAEVAYSETRPVDKDTIVDRVIDDLRRVKGLGANDRVIMKTTRDVPFAYCLYDMHRRDALRTILKWLRSTAIVPCGRYGMWTYFWSDEAMLSGRRAAQVVSQRKGISTH